LPEFVFSFRDYWNRRGLFQESIRWHKAALVILGDTPSTLLGNLYNSLTGIAYRTGNYELSQQYGLRTIEIADFTKDDRLLARANNNLAMVFIEQGEIDRARALYKANIEKTLHWNDRQFYGTTLSNLGDLETVAEHWDEAIEWLEQAVEVFQNGENQLKLARVNCNLALALKRSGDIESSVEVLRDSFRIWKQILDEPYIGDGIHLLAEILVDREEYAVGVLLMAASKRILLRCGTQLRDFEIERQRVALARAKEHLSRSEVTRANQLGASMQASDAVLRCLEILTRK
jgi:tetratricopeptide (TPR) repeat protein